MPDPKAFKECLMNFSDFAVFPPIDRALIARLDMVVEKYIPEIVRDADIIANGGILAKQRVVHEPTGGDSTDSKETDEQQQPELQKETKQPPSTTLISLGNIFILILCLLLAAEGAYYSAYSKLAYSPQELHDGLGKLLDFATKNGKLNYPVASDSRKQSRGSQTPPTMLSSLPTMSGISYGTAPSKQPAPASKEEL